VTRAHRSGYPAGVIYGCCRSRQDCGPRARSLASPAEWWVNGVLSSYCSVQGALCRLEFKHIRPCDMRGRRMGLALPVLHWDRGVPRRNVWRHSSWRQEMMTNGNLT
jgi:hypothetical protein